MTGRMRTDAGTVHVLHVFGTMQRGGAETRMLEMMRRIDGQRYRFDFCVLSGKPGAYAAEIEERGGSVIPCPIRPNPVFFVLRFFALLRRGRYDVVDSHVYQFSGLVLLVARLAGVRRRVSHLHSTADGHAPTVRRRLYRACMRRLLDAHATAIVGCSQGTMDAFWGAGWECDPRKTVVFCGVEVDRFRTGEGGRDLRDELGVPPAASVILHVARFDPPKNHAGLVRIAQALLARRRDVVFVLVGDGSLRASIQADVDRAGLAPWFRFVGARDDVPRLLAAADVFVLPSLWEGLPTVVIEALAAGIPVVASAALSGVHEIAAHASGVVTADAADPAAFAQRLDEVLAGGEALRPSALPEAFTTEFSLARVLECYV